MFTGIIEAIGEVVALQPKNGDLRLRIKTNNLDLGDVVNGWVMLFSRVFKPREISAS